MAARAQLLGDVGDERARELGGRARAARDIHIMVMISARTRRRWTRTTRGCARTIERSGGLTIVGDQLGASLPDGRIEHFDFADGLRQPAIEGSGQPARPGQGAPTRRPGLAADPRRRVHPRLPRRGGRPAHRAAARRADRRTALTSSTASCARTSRRSARSWTRPQGCPGAEELLAAKVVGRWRDGTPLELSPQASRPRARRRQDSATTPSPTARTPAARAARSAATYAAPTRATACRSRAQLVNRHRLIRRGIAYGDAAAAGSPRTTAPTGDCCSCACRRASRASSSSSSRSGSTTATRCGLGDDQDVLVGPQDGRPPARCTVRDAAVVAGPAVAGGDDARRGVLLRARRQRAPSHRRGVLLIRAASC